MTAIKAYDGENHSVIYEYEDGRMEQWIGGSRTWRNQNPGDVFFNKANDWLGQIGKAGPFCVFNDPEMGRRATRKILEKHAKQQETLEKFMHSYAPTFENDTAGYIGDLEKWTGISRTTNLGTLSPEKMEALAQGIFRREGWEVGTVKVLKPSKSTKAGKYIWHTVHDEKVRGVHAERDGKVFDFANPPKGGNPGEDYHCRCWAEPIHDAPLTNIFGK